MTILTYLLSYLVVFISFCTSYKSDRINFFSNIEFTKSTFIYIYILYLYWKVIKFLPGLLFYMGDSHSFHWNNVQLTFRSVLNVIRYKYEQNLIRTEKKLSACDIFILVTNDPSAIDIHCNLRDYCKELHTNTEDKKKGNVCVVRMSNP